MADKSSAYCDNPYLRSYGVERMREKMIRRYGQRYFEYRRRWEDAENKYATEFPVNLELDLIDACTLACPQCLRSSDLLPQYKDYLGKGSRLDYDIILKMLDEGQQHYLPSVNIGGGGECMLHPRFTDICKAIMDHDVIELRVISNGTLLKSDISEALIDQQVHFLSISIDAHSPETYGQVRGRLDFYERVVENVHRFLELRTARNSEFPMLRVTFVNQPKNRHEASEFLKYWSSHADLVDVQTYSDFRKKDLRADFNCNQPWKRLAIYADGHVVPCCGFPGIKFDLGSVYDHSLYDIWHGKKLRRMREALLQKKYPPPCLQCMGSLEKVN